jgi:hypothetical protein
MTNTEIIKHFIFEAGSSIVSVRGLKSGLGKCEWHWTAGNWGRQWALQTIGGQKLFNQHY